MAPASRPAEWVTDSEAGHFRRDRDTRRAVGSEEPAVGSSELTQPLGIAEQLPITLRPIPVERPAGPAWPAGPHGVRLSSVSRLEVGYAQVMAEILGIPQVPSTSNFFDDLGADSMIMARFCARVRSRSDLPNVAIRNTYKAPTIAALAAAMAGQETTSAPQPTIVTPFVPGTAEPGPQRPDTRTAALPAPVGTLRALLCGFLQLVFLLGYPALVAAAFGLATEWVLTAPTDLDIYIRSVGMAGGLFLGMSLLPVLAKWLLVGRWTETRFPVWSLRYYRLWLVKTLLRTSPVVRLAGTPLFVFYLRLLGAKIGKGVTILSPTVPVCTDLLTVGDGTIIRKASLFSCYRAVDGVIETGRVTIGADALVGEATVLDVGTSIGDRGQLGHSSALHAGQAVPADERWHGSPAEPTSVDYRAVPSTSSSALRRLVYSCTQLVVLFGIVLPLGLSGLALLVRDVPPVQQLFRDVETAAAHVPFVYDVLILSTVLYVGGLLLALLVFTTVPRLLMLVLRPDRTYRLYGSAYWALRTISRLTNNKFYTQTFGDSSYIVGYLRAIGYRFGAVEQTGSNFGMAVAHDIPFLCEVGSGTVVADRLTMLNADYSNTSFTVSRVRIGAHSFLGNQIFYPARSRVGDDCLLATKVMVPLDGRVRHGVGLLGSPSFEIPRLAERDARLALGPEERRRGLAAKNRHNIVTILLFLLSRWVQITLVVLLARVALDLWPQIGPLAIAGLAVAEMLLIYAYFILVDVMVRRLKAFEPHGVSIYDRTFWRHERYWKLSADTYIAWLNGTPFKGALWRLLGVRVGRRLFDDGAFMSERSFVALGDDVTLNERSTIQCHSQENDAFKSDHSVIGSGVTIGVGGFVHYGTHLGDGSCLEADSFLMKGEEIAPNTRWGGNPAVELDATPALITSGLRKCS